MKKLLACLLVLAMVLSVAACGGPEDVRGTKGDSTPASQDEEFSLGENDGLKYESKFIGIGCTLPKGWSFYTDEQIKELNNLTQEMAGEEFTEAIENATVVYDMYATSEDMASNCIVNLEKTNAVVLLALDVKDVYKNQQETIKAAYENMGAEDVTFEISTVTIGDKSFDCMNMSAKLYEVTLNQTMFCIKCNGYLASVAITADSAEAVADVLDCFYLV